MNATEKSETVVDLKTNRIVTVTQDTAAKMAMEESKRIREIGLNIFKIVPPR